MISKRLTAVYIVFILMASIFPTISGSGGIPPAEASGFEPLFSGGSGTASDPYRISNVTELQWMGNTSNLNKHFVLVNDINASITVNWNSGAGFVPIGANSNSFTGSLDGKGYNIMGLFINRSGTNYQGLFGYIGTGSMVKNVNLINNCVTGRNYVGGLVGLSDSGTVTNCSAAGNTMGRITVGGLFGHFSGTATNCSVTGNVSGIMYSVGGLLGSNSGSVTSCYAISYTRGSWDVGGLVGYNSFSSTVKNCYAEGTTSGSNSVGGLIGNYHPDSVILNSHYNINGSLINNDHYVTLGGLFNDQYQDWYSNGLFLRLSNYSQSLVPNGSYYDILSIQGLKDLLGFADNINYRFRLASDIDLSPAPGLYIPYLASKDFDGRGYNISNLRLNQSFSSHLGMFGGIRLGSAVSNLKLMNIINNGSNQVGGLVGYNGGTVTNCYVTGTTSGTSNVGGLVGSNGGTVTNCYATGSTSGNYYVGGLVGWNSVTVRNSYANGTTSGYENVGGLVGYSNGILVNCYTIGNVSGIYGYVGGLIGKNRGTVSNSYATGAVIRSSGTNTAFGGFVGSNGGKIINCYSIGRVIYEGITDPTDKGFAGNVDIGSDYEMKDNFWDTQTSGQTSTKGEATGGNTKWMMTLKTFKEARWDIVHVREYIDEVWYIDEVYDYPRLGWESYQDIHSPVANAGPDQTVNMSETVFLNGWMSSDNIRIVNYTWTFTDDVFINLYGGQPSYQFKNHGEFLVTLNVTDAAGNWDTDTMTVTVLDTQLPVADAGLDRIINMGETVHFNASLSTDNVGIINYTWSFTDGEPIILFGMLQSYRFDNAGVFVVTLNVIDAADNWAMDTMTVTVLDTQAPFADAGPNQTIKMRETAHFKASLSTDNVGIINYTWSFTDGEPIILFGMLQSYQFDNAGVFVVTLNVTDATGNWATDTMTVTVLDTQVPSANAGPNQIINMGETVHFNASLSTDNVGIITYTWSFTDGVPIILYGILQSHQFDNAGAFVVTLNVTDVAGNWATDTMTVTVKDIALPIANAGPDIMVDEGTTITFDGTLSTDNVGIVNYTWTFTDGKSITLYGPTPEYIFNNPGLFIVALTVVDAAGNWATATVEVSVRDITSPIAIAGTDKRVAVGTTVILNGSLSTDNVGIVRYSWTFIYDGSERTIEGSVVEFVFDKAGTYEIELTVYDAYDNIGKDSVIIIVINTGIVKGIVLDDKGDPVEGAEVEITASNGEIRTATTGSDGSFFLEIHHGSFDWKITKDGYKPISGTGSVNAMEEMTLDLSDAPLVKEKKTGTNMLLLMILIIVIVLIILGIAIFLFTRKKKEEPSEGKEKMEDPPVEDKEADPSSEGSIPLEDPLSGGSPPEGSSQEDGGEMEQDPIVENGEGPVPEEEDPLSILDELVNTQKQDGDPGI